MAEVRTADEFAGVHVKEEGFRWKEDREGEHGRRDKEQLASFQAQPCKIGINPTP